MSEITNEMKEIIVRFKEYEDNKNSNKNKTYISKENIQSSLRQTLIQSFALALLAIFLFIYGNGEPYSVFTMASTFFIFLIYNLWLKLGLENFINKPRINIMELISKSLYGLIILFVFFSLVEKLLLMNGWFEMDIYPTSIIIGAVVGQFFLTMFNINKIEKNAMTDELIQKTKNNYFDKIIELEEFFTSRINTIPKSILLLKILEENNLHHSIHFLKYHLDDLLKKEGFNSPEDYILNKMEKEIENENDNFIENE